MAIDKYFAKSAEMIAANTAHYLRPHRDKEIERYFFELFLGVEEHIMDSLMDRFHDAKHSLRRMHTSVRANGHVQTLAIVCDNYDGTDPKTIIRLAAVQATDGSVVVTDTLRPNSPHLALLKTNNRELGRRSVVNILRYVEDVATSALSEAVGRKYVLLADRAPLRVVSNG